MIYALIGAIALAATACIVAAMARDARTGRDPW